MLVDCPECGASLEGSSGTEMVCPACMTPFLVPSSARAVHAFDVQTGGEPVLHGLSRYAIREAIYLGRLTAAARVRHGGGRWELIGGYPEFASVFRLLGGDLAPMAGTRKLAGWGRSSAPPEPSGPRHSRPAPPAPVAPRASEAALPMGEAPSAPIETFAAAAPSSSGAAGLSVATASFAPAASGPARAPAEASGTRAVGGHAPSARRAPPAEAPKGGSGARVLLLGGVLVALAGLAFLLR